MVLLANLFFLAKFGPVYLLLPLAALVDFAVGLRLDSSGKAPGMAPSLRKTWVSLSLLVNVGLLLFFKTLPLFDGKWGGRTLGWMFSLSLSFYCFQALSYTIDVYRGDAKAERSPLAYLASALFFPTILAGPIPRTTKLLRQWTKPFGLTRQQGAAALLLIATGLVKKLLVADYLADNFVNRVFDTPLLYSGVENLLAVYGYALQLFFDFSGYTDIAMGVAMLLGFQVPENFRTPYLSVNLQDFWKRWHISFSSWLTDYLFESLPKRRSWLRLSFSYAILTTFLLGGLWHGITWNFLIWGALHGVVLSLVFVWSQSRWKKGRKRRLGEGPLWARVLGAVVTFHFVCFTWVFFRAQDLATAKLMLQQILSHTPGTENLTPALWGVLGFAALAQAIPQDWFDRAAKWAEAVPFWVQGTAMAGVVLVIQALAGKGSAGFVYGAF